MAIHGINLRRIMGAHARLMIKVKADSAGGRGAAHAGNPLLRHRHRQEESASVKAITLSGVSVRKGVQPLCEPGERARPAPGGRADVMAPRAP